MAEKAKVAKPASTDEVEMVKFENLAQAKVQVVDKDGNRMYLEPSFRSGMYVLRVMPK